MGLADGRVGEEITSRSKVSLISIISLVYLIRMQSAVTFVTFIKVFDSLVPTIWCCTQLKTSVLGHRLSVLSKNYYDPRSILGINGQEYEQTLAYFDKVKRL